MSDVTEQPQSSFLQETFTPIINAVGWEAIALLVLFLFLILTDPKKKGELASGRLAKGKEKRAASKLAKQQMRTRKRNQVSLYFGNPPANLALSSPPSENPLYSGSPRRDCHCRGTRKRENFLHD